MILSYFVFLALGAWMMWIYMKGRYHKDYKDYHKIKKEGKTCTGCLYYDGECASPAQCEKTKGGYYTGYVKDWEDEGDD